MAQTDRWYSSPTQIFWVCKSLIAGRVLSTKTEIREVNGWRLAAVTEKLRKHYGWPILAALHRADVELTGGGSA